MTKAKENREFWTSVGKHWTSICSRCSRHKRIGHIIIGIILFAVMVILGPMLFADSKNLYENIYTMAIGIVVTIFIIDQLAKLRDEEQERQALIFQLGSPNQSVATEAARLLSLRGWHNNGSLIGARLSNAMLEGAQLYQFDLTESQLQGVNLSKATLTQTNLNGARLDGANLKKALLKDVCMRNAEVTRADFTDAELLRIDDEGVDWSTAENIPEGFREMIIQREQSHQVKNQGSDKYNVRLVLEQVIHALKESSSVRSRIYVDPSKPSNEITPIRSIIKNIASIFPPESLKTGGGAKRTIFICKKNESGTTEIIAESDEVKQEIVSDFFSSSTCLFDSHHLLAPSYITTDIKIGSGIIGILAVVSNVENDLDPKDPVFKGFLDLFADQVAATLLRHRFQVMTTKLFSQVNEGVQKRELLNTILEVAAYLLQSSRGGFYEYDQYTEMVTLVAPFNQDDAEGLTMSVGKGVAGLLVKEKRDHIIIKDYRTWPNRNDKFGDRPEYAAVLGVLLKRQDASIIGSFSLDCHVDRGWNTADAEILRSFGDYVQLAYEQLDRLQRFKSIRDAARDIGNLPVVAMSLEAVITFIAEKAGSALKQHLISLLILKEPEVEDATPVIWISATGCNKADNVVRVDAFDLLRNPDTILRKPHRPKEIKLKQMVDYATFRPGDEPVVKYLKEHDIKKVTLVPLRISQTEGFIGVAVIGSRDGDQVIDKHDLILLANQIGTIVSHHQDFKDNINHLGSTAHALRRPLTELLHNAQILQLHEESKEGESHHLNSKEQRGCLKEIIKYTRIQDRHITRILDLAHLRLHDKQIKEDKIKLSGIITKAMNEYEEYAKNDRIKLQIEQLSEINAQEVIGDTTLIQNALDAIIDNAIDTINRKGKEDGCIILREGSIGKYGIIEVEDNGQGIKEEDKLRIFMQGETSKETVGHGMGLPYAIKVVSKQGGKIECDSEVGKGTTFRIFIPLHSLSQSI